MPDNNAPHDAPDRAYEMWCEMRHDLEKQISILRGSYRSVTSEEGNTALAELLARLETRFALYSAEAKVRWPDRP